jgi:hypothetical protein
MRARIKKKIQYLLTLEVPHLIHFCLSRGSDPLASNGVSYIVIPSLSCKKIGRREFPLDYSFKTRVIFP